MNFLQRCGWRSVSGFQRYTHECLDPSPFVTLMNPTHYRLKDLHMRHIELYAFSNAEYFKENPDREFRPDLVVNKIMAKRKGMCMELNFAFGLLLNRLGYGVRFVKCFKPHHDGFFDIFHLGLIVETRDNADYSLPDRYYFVDVGFGEYFRKPISFVHGETTDGVRIESKNDSHYVLDDKDGSLILRVDTDVVNVQDIRNNLALFYRSGPKDFPLCRILFERIYDKGEESFVEYNDSIIRSKL